MRTLRRLPLLLVLGLLFAPGAAAGPPARAAATCSDYSNQAEAQREKDTRDADGDGVYCESLPCPCAKPGGKPQGDSGARRAQGRGPERGHEPAPERAGVHALATGRAGDASTAHPVALPT